MSKTSKEALIAELKQEATSTRLVLKAVPMDNAKWKPHEKSMPIKSLAIHIAELFSWISDIVNKPELDFATFVYKPVELTTSEELLTYFDSVVADNIKLLETIDDAVLNENWTMRNGDQIYFTIPKIDAIRTWSFNHLYHHRGQMTVYLRLLNIPVPSVYGPSADSK